ncbi:hypothetical protein EB796_013254 [Bugula neritina]|uniref:Uncharacterized protein n=1 Tax=Bugula neritina TaxID=10212 RepID=A0A7J7JSK2_BUGNE|nr:hypothetical protein EB796_013254 [Bugula neritina]
MVGGIAQSTSFSPSLESRNNNLAKYRSASQGRLSNFETSVVSAYKNDSSRASGYPLPDLNSDEKSELSSGSTFKTSKSIKVPLPTFSGDRRAWVDFRSIWRKHADREYDDDIEREWALKSCLKDKALDVVKPILVTQEGAYARMWKRLDEIYCDVSLNIQSVHSDLKKLRPVLEDLMGLIKFVDQVELSYSQLGEVAQVNSVTMPMVDELCDLLPVPIRKEWMKIYRAASLEEKLHPFSLFMSYLEDERAISRRLAERQQRKNEKSIRKHGRIAEPSSVHNCDKHVNRCIIHNKPHPTEEC